MKKAVTTSKKTLSDFTVRDNIEITSMYSLLKLIPESDGLYNLLATIKPGQFVQVMPPNNSTYLRRPISVCYVDTKHSELWLLVRKAGEGTAAINQSQSGDRLSLILPLGNGFSLTDDISAPLLVGGGVGVAPLLYLGKALSDRGITPKFLLGARSKNDLLLIEQFNEIGDVFLSTEDGSIGDKGLVTVNPALSQNYDFIYCCGPMPMMKAVASIAKQKGVDCEVSLENVMACGVGACLCCVEKTTKGNVCVCTEGPVFNINKLLW